MNDTKPGPGLVRSAIFDPVGTARVARRLANFVRLTSKHLRQIPDDAPQAELNQRANAWAQLLLPAMGVDLEVVGRENVETIDGGALLVSNHRSYVDVIALLGATPCCFLAKGDVADWPVLGKAAVRVGTVFVERDAQDSRTAARHAMRELLEAGYKVVVFPEGTTYRGPGCADFRLGAFATAQEAGVPVVPIAIEYAHPEDAWQDEGFVAHFNRKFRRPTIKASLHIGPPLENDDAMELMNTTRDWIDTRLRDLWNSFGHQPANE